MSTEKIIRSSGIVAVLAGGFWALHEIGQLVGLVPRSSDAALDLVAHMLVAISVIGLYARQANRAGLLGLVAFVVYMVAAMVNQGMKHIYTYVVPTLSTQFPEAGLAIGATPAWGFFQAAWVWLTLLAPILFGIATLRAKVLPRWAAALMIFGPVVSMVFAIPAGNPGAVLSALAIAGLGYGAWSKPAEMAPAGQTLPVV
jgi:hypothetical protein